MHSFYYYFRWSSLLTQMVIMSASKVKGILVSENGGPDVLKYQDLEIKAPGPRSGTRQNCRLRRKFYRHLSTYRPLRCAIALYPWHGRSRSS